MARIFEFLLYVLGMVIFAVFVWGSFDLISARGRQEKVTAGKGMLGGALWGGFFVLIAWQMVNMIFFWLGTPAGTPLFTHPDTIADTTSGEESVTFKLFGNPWNYLCEADIEYANPNQKVCFGRGDGTPCKIAEGKETTGHWGYCVKGVCDRDDQNVCDYLVTTYPEYFGSIGERAALGSYKCQPKPENYPKITKGGKVDEKKQLDCITEPNLCNNINTSTPGCTTPENCYCCGEVYVK
jgi:hypothetical protein